MQTRLLQNRLLVDGSCAEFCEFDGSIIIGIHRLHYSVRLVGWVGEAHFSQALNKLLTSQHAIRIFIQRREHFLQLLLFHGAHEVDLDEGEAGLLEADVAVERTNIPH